MVLIILNFHVKIEKLWIFCNEDTEKAKKSEVVNVSGKNRAVYKLTVIDLENCFTTVDDRIKTASIFFKSAALTLAGSSSLSAS